MFTGILVGAILGVLGAVLYYKVLPLRDVGHRAFAVTNKKAVKAILEVLSKNGLQERFSFDAGPTHQTLMSDNTTVLIQHEEENNSPNGLSLAVRNPLESAHLAALILKSFGFTAEAKEMTGLERRLVVVTSNAFMGWSLVFRRHILAMGPPPNKRRLTQ